MSTETNEQASNAIESSTLLDALEKELALTKMAEHRFDVCGQDGNAANQEFKAFGLEFAINLIKEAQSNVNHEPRGAKE